MEIGERIGERIGDFRLKIPLFGKVVGQDLRGLIRNFGKNFCKKCLLEPIVIQPSVNERTHIGARILYRLFHGHI